MTSHSIRLVRLGLQGLAALACSSGAIAASDCPGNSAVDEMVRVGPLCVDKYEASVWDVDGGKGNRYPQGNPRYPSWFPSTGNWSKPLYAASVAGVHPSTFLTWFQAQQACANAGKRLLTNAEWQMAAAGTPDPGVHGDGVARCNTNTTGMLPTGQARDCKSRWGVHDMVGNVKEWVADWIQGPGVTATGGLSNLFTPGDREAASTEYGDDWVTGVNEAVHQDAPQSGEPNLGQPDGLPAGIARGGLWSSGKGAGVFTFDAWHTPSSRDNATGFRCAR